MKTKHVIRARLFRAAITSAELLAAESVDAAVEAGRQDIADKLTSALALIERAHARAGEAAAMIAQHYGDPVALWSGPEDKPPPPGTQ